MRTATTARAVLEEVPVFDSRPPGPFTLRRVAGVIAAALMLALTLSCVVGYTAGIERCLAVVADQAHEERLARDGRWGESRGSGNPGVLEVRSSVRLAGASLAMVASPAILAQPAAAEASPTVTPVPEPADASGLAALALAGFAALRDGKTSVGVGLLLMVLVWIARKLAPSKVPKRYLAPVVLGLTALGGFAAAIAAGLPVIDSALTTLVLGAAAIGFWEAAFKHIAALMNEKGPGD